jgi:hypothetical protein
LAYFALPKGFDIAHRLGEMSGQLHPKLETRRA